MWLPKKERCQKRKDKMIRIIFPNKEILYKQVMWSTQRENCQNKMMSYQRREIMWHRVTTSTRPRGENSRIPWSRTLDDYEQRIKVLEEKVCKCAETKPWVCGSGTQCDLLELVDEELEYVDEPAPLLLSLSYGTPDLINEGREDQEVLQVVVPSCCAQPSPNPSTQVRGLLKSLQMMGEKD